MFLLALPVLGMAQEGTTVVSTQPEKTAEVTPKKEATASESSTLNAKIKHQLIKLNHKKSNEIISIKAYKKSLQIKVKTIKLC